MNDVMVDLRQSPDNWPRVELGGLCDIIGGFAAPKGDAPFRDGSIPFVRMRDLGRYHRTTNLLETKERLNSNYVSEHKLRIVRKGSILIPRSGSVSLNHRAILGVDACIVSHICALVPKVSSVDTHYLYYALSNFDMRNIMRKTTGLDAITFEEVKQIKIPLPPLCVQRVITSILQRADTLKDKRRRTNRLMNKMTRSIFLRMFGDPAMNPMRWQVRKLTSVCEKITDGTHRTPKYLPSGIPFLSVKNVVNGYLDFTDVRFISQEEHAELTRRCKPEFGDVLYTKVGVNFGRATLVDTRTEFSIFVSVALLKPKKHVIDSRFLVSMLNSEYLQSQARRRVKGIGVPDLHLEEIRDFDVILPPLQIQQGFSRMAEKVELVKSRQGESMHEISVLFHSLMSRAFRGQLVL